MEKEDRLSELLSGKTKEVCEFCSFFERDMNDPQGVGGTCGKDGEFCFCFEYCNKFVLIKNKKEE